MIQVESDRTVNPGHSVEERELFQNALGRLASVECVHDGVQGNEHSGHVVAPVALLDVLTVHSSPLLRLYETKTAADSAARDPEGSSEPATSAVASLDRIHSAVGNTPVAMRIGGRRCGHRRRSATGRWRGLDSTAPDGPNGNRPARQRYDARRPS